MPSAQYKDERCAALLSALLAHDDKAVKAIVAKDSVREGEERRERKEGRKRGRRERKV